MLYSVFKVHYFYENHSLNLRMHLPIRLIHQLISFRTVSPKGLPAYAQNKAGKQKKCHLLNANDTVITLLNCFWLKPNLILIY